MSEPPGPIPQPVLSAIQAAIPEAALTAEAEAALRSLGFDDPRRGFGNLRRLAGHMADADFGLIVPALLTELARSPHADMALNNLERVASTCADPSALAATWLRAPKSLAVLIQLCGGSQLLADILQDAATEFCAAFEETPAPERRSREQLLDAAGAAVRVSGGLQARLAGLRRLKRGELLRIATRDILQMASFGQLVEEISDLAAACLEVALELSWEQVPVPDLPGELGAPADWWRAFAVIAMGKLGGRELNYSSDVDLLFVYDTPWAPPDTTPEAARSYFTRLATALTQALGALTADGALFRVDLRLRPEGGAGSVARSLKSYATYYESWGAVWERQALIKASHVAGDRELAERFLAMAEAFVYGKRLDTDGVAEIKAVKRRVEASARRAGRAQDVKLGPGCVRDIEFTVQLLQLIFGTQDPQVRKKSTLGALRALGAGKYISLTEHRTLASAYVFLRTVEHQLQLMYGLSTRELPQEDEALDRLAQRLGLSGQPGTRPGQLLLSEYRRHTANVRALFGKLFSEMLEVRAESDMRARSLILSREEPEADEAEALGEYGLTHRRQALTLLRRLAHGRPTAPSPASVAEQFADLAPIVLQAASRTPDPDASLRNFERFCELIGSHGALYSVLADQPQAIQMLVRLAGCSASLSSILVRHPEYFDMLMDAGLMAATCSREELAENLALRLEGIRAPEAAIEPVLRFRRRELLRVGVRDLMNDADIETTLAELTDIADVCLSALVDAATREVVGPEAAAVPLAVIGLGKLGGRELHYNSDLDVMFVWASGSGAPEADHTLYNRVAEAVLAAPGRVGSGEGPPLAIDARLRPEGQSGPLARSVEACAEYYGRWAEPWERMALTRARVVAGDLEVGRAALGAAEGFLWGQGLTVGELDQILHTKHRIEAERARTDGARIDIKLGPGGISDIEFCVQLLQLAHGHEDASLRVVGTLRGLRALARAERFPDREAGGALEAAYRFLRRTECRLQIVHDWSESTIEPGTGGFEQLARLLEYETEHGRADAERFAADLDRHRAAARRAFEQTVECLKASP